MQDCTIDRPIVRSAGHRFVDRVAPGVLIPAGTLYAISPVDGLAYPAVYPSTTSTGLSHSPLKARAVALERVDTRDGTEGAVVHGEAGVFFFAHEADKEGSTAERVSPIQLGTEPTSAGCHTVDGYTVRRTYNNAARAGTPLAVTNEGVWVRVGR